MLLIKKHSFIIDKPVDIVRSDLISSTENIIVKELSEIKLHGLMKNTYGTGFDIISNINLTPISFNKTIVEIKNKFDLLTNLFMIFIFVLACGLLIYNLIIEQNNLNFHSISLMTFSIISIVITIVSFRIYNKRIMKIYKSLLFNKIPN